MVVVRDRRVPQVDIRNHIRRFCMFFARHIGFELPVIELDVKQRSLMRAEFF